MTALKNQLSTLQTDNISNTDQKYEIDRLEDDIDDKEDDIDDQDDEVDDAEDYLDDMKDAVDDAKDEFRRIRRLCSGSIY